jgi:hypothetical protein
MGTAFLLSYLEVVFQFLLGIAGASRCMAQGQKGAVVPPL